jgi:hypothetical protein
VTVEQVRVGDVLELQRRAVKVEAAAQYREIGLRSFGRGVFHKEPVTGVDLGGKRVFEIHPGDLLLSNVFAWEGAVAVAGPPERGFIGSHRFMTYTPQAEVDVTYLSQYFVSEPGLRQLQGAPPGSAGRNRTLSIRAFEDLVIPLPDLATQRHIAARLDTQRVIHQAAVEATGRVVLRRQQLRDRLLTADVRVPLVDMLVPVRSPVTVSSQGIYSTAGLLNRGRGLFARPPMAGSETKYRTLTMLRPGQLVYSKLFGWEGSVAVVPPAFEGYFVSQEFPVFDVRDQDLTAYLAHAVRGSGFVDQMAGAASGMGQRRQRVNPDRFLAVEVPVPSRAERTRIVGRLDAVERIVDVAKRRTALAEALLPALRTAEFARLAGD